MPPIDILLPPDGADPAQLDDPQRDDSLVDSPLDLMPAVSDGVQAQAGDRLMDYVSSHPVTAVLVSAAAGAGTMALVMLGARSKSRSPDNLVAASTAARSKPMWLSIVAGVLAAWLTPRATRKDTGDPDLLPH